MDHDKLWKILKEMGISDHLTCLLRNLYAGLEATVRTKHGLVQNWERSMSRLCIVTWLINFYAVRNARLDESRTGIRIAGENINNLRYADYITLMAESEEELKSLLMKVKEKSEKLA